MKDGSLKSIKQLDVLFVVVLYRQLISDSKSCSSLINILGINGTSPTAKVLVCDNSDNPLNKNVAEHYGWTYFSCGAYNSLSYAYNLALNYAKSNQISWIALFDQDTEIDQSYIRELFILTNKLSSIKDVVSIVPMLHLKNVQFSPSVEYVGGILRPLKLTKFYAYEKIFAVASCTAIKVSFLDDLGGFSQEFRVDFVDRWLCEQIHRSNKKIYVMNIKLQHRLSIMNFLDEVTPARYESIVMAEKKFMRDYRSHVDNVVYLLRVMFRILKMSSNPRYLPYRKILFRIFFAKFGKN